MSTPVNIFKESWYYLGMRYPKVADWFNRAFIDYQAKVNRRISITEFGDYLHLSQPTISAYMNGTRKPSFDKAKEICTILGDVALMEILGYSLSELGPLTYSALPPEFAKALREAELEIINTLKTRGISENSPAAESLSREILEKYLSRLISTTKSGNEAE